MDNEQDIYYNEFFEGVPKLSKEDLKIWIEEHRRRKKTFAEHPTVNNLTRRDIWTDRAKFYFLPFMINCYRFTRQNRLPYFAIPVSPTCMFYRDRLHLRNWMDTIHDAFFRCMDMCLKKGEKIMLLVEKRFHIEDPVDGGTQQLYNMLWDVDLSALVGNDRIHKPSKVILPKDGRNPPTPRMGLVREDGSPSWNWDDLNPGFDRENGIDLCRRTLWFQDDLYFLCKKYTLLDECVFKPEILDTSRYPDDKQDIYAMTAREFYFKVFEPKDVDQDDGDDMESSDSDFDDYDGFDSDDTELDMIDSTTNFDEDDDEMNKIIAFFAKMPKVTGLVQGMMDMIQALTRVLPLVIVKLDDDKLKQPLERVVNILNAGLGKILKICAYLGIKVERKESGALQQIVKNRFKKDKKDFIEYEIDELNNTLDSLEKVDSDAGDGKPPKPLKGQIPIDVKPTHLYPQKMPLGPHPPPPTVVPPEPPSVPVKPHPPHPPKPDETPPEPPPIPSMMPEPPNKPPKNENGIK